jgi:formyltetrahydrofolate synthetase
MRTNYIAFLVLAAVCVLAAVSSCSTLAVTGAKKYRVDITNAVNAVSADINSDGKISDRVLGKLQKVLDKNRTEFGKNGTFVKSEEILKLIDEAKADPTNAFEKYQQVQQNVTYIVDMIRTEVPDS